MEGSSEVELYLSEIYQTIRKHVSDDSGSTEIYNRAYEAVSRAIRTKDATISELTRVLERVVAWPPNHSMLPEIKDVLKKTKEQR